MSREAAKRGVQNRKGKGEIAKKDYRDVNLRKGGKMSSLLADSHVEAKKKSCYRLEEKNICSKRSRFGKRKRQGVDRELLAWNLEKRDYTAVRRKLNLIQKKKKKKKKTKPINKLSEILWNSAHTKRRKRKLTDLYFVGCERGVGSKIKFIS